MKYTRQEFMKKCQISEPTYNDLLHKGKIVVIEGLLESTDRENHAYLSGRIASLSRAANKRFKGGPNRQEVELKKIQHQTDILEIRKNKERGELIDRKLVAAFQGKLHSIDSNEFKNLGYKVSARLLGALEIKDEAKLAVANNIIQSEVVKILQNKKELINEWLRSIEAEELE